MSYEAAEEHLELALGLIDRLGEFFAAEHAWLKGTDDWQSLSWEAKVEAVVDRHGFELPEMYETMIHLAHCLQAILRELKQ